MRPEFFKHVELYEAEAATGLPLRVAFSGLWTVADRRGIFPWSRSLKPEILPYDPCDFWAVLEALYGAGFVGRYQAGGKTYGIIPTFTAHQNFHVHEKESAAPAPDDVDACMITAQHKHYADMMQALDEHDAEPAPINLSSTSTSISASTQQPASRAKANWLSPYLDCWREFFPKVKDKSIAGQMAKAIKPLTDDYDAVEICGQLRNYVGQVGTQYASPAGFARGFGTWTGHKQGGGVDDRITRGRASLRAFVHSQEGTNGKPSDHREVPRRIPRVVSDTGSD